MVSVHVENLGDVAIVECEGRIVSSDAAFTLRNAVASLPNVHTVILDLSEVDAIGGGGVGMLAFLQRWAQAQGIRLKLFNPSRSLRQRLEHTTSIPAFDFATIDEVIAYLARAVNHGTVVLPEPRHATGERHG